MPIWILVVQWVSRLVLIVLFGLSVWSVSIMLDRYRIFKAFDQEGSFDDVRGFIRAKNWGSLKSALQSRHGLRSGTLSAALDAQGRKSEYVDRSVKSYLIQEKTKLERGFTTLATLGSNAPFIGLFGTVLGIIQAFGSLANSQSSTTAVMSGISEALVATAVGLFVAIPAVVAYNVFTRKLKVAISDCEALKDFFLAFREE